ncbi:MAG: alpha/beta hydrolase [Rudaea sp.]
MTRPDPVKFPSAATTLSLRGPVGVLEAAIDLPEVNTARAGTAIVCHPHPQHGGSLHNKVVTMLARSLRESGLASVAFNFRGVGASQGSYDDGVGETEDLLAVAAWVQDVRPDDVLWLAGFSFGSYVATRAAAQLPLQQLILVAPPVSRWDFAAFVARCPLLVIQGEADEVVDPAAVFAWAAALTPAPAVVRMPDTGHFFHRRLMDLRGAVKNGVRSNLPPVRTHA